MKPTRGETTEISSRASRNSMRKKIISEIIQKSRLVMSYSTLNIDDLTDSVKVWEEILEDIPDDWLDRSYKTAMKTHKSGPFGAYEICAAYQCLIESGSIRLDPEVDKLASLSKGAESKYLIEDTIDELGSCPIDILEQMKVTIKEAKGPLRSVLLSGLPRRGGGFSVEFNEDEVEE